MCFIQDWRRTTTLNRNVNTMCSFEVELLMRYTFVAMDQGVPNRQESTGMY